MKKLFLKWRLVKLLDEIYEEAGVSLTREDFLEHVLTTKWYRYWYSKIHWYMSADKLYRRLDNSLDDCIQGTKNYIDYTNPPDTALKDPLTGYFINSVNTDLKVAEPGREFISKWRLELALGLIPQTLTLLTGGVLVILFRPFYNLIARYLSWPIW